MPLTGTGMKSAILTAFALDSVDGMDDTTKALIEERVDLLASAIVTYIKNNALVNTTVVTTGSAAAQTGTGVGTVS